MRTEAANITILHESDLTQAVLEVGRIARALGFDDLERSRSMTAVSELARNILKYAGTGTVRVVRLDGLQGRGLEIVAEDHGPGIADLELALEDNFSTSGTLGLGLPGVRRLMDDFEIESQPGSGTRVVVRKWL
jgi:serine/threonine-protein kinase RsbT